jgi:hypothetical protein
MTEGAATVNEPTPEEAEAALRAVREGRQQVIKSAAGSRWLWIVSGLIVFGYSAANDLVPATRPWLTWVLFAIVLGFVFILRTRVGSSWLGRPVTVSSKSLPLTFKWKLFRMLPIFGIAILAGVLIPLLHLPHGEIYYGALAGLYIMFFGHRFQLWLLRRQDED